MSGHIWDVKRAYEGTTLMGAESAFRYAISQGAEFLVALSFTGYAVESSRQKGGISTKTVWDGAVRSKYRFMNGKNADSYLYAGRRMLEQAAPLFEFREGTPAEMIYDKVLEDGPLAQARRFLEFLTPTPVRSSVPIVEEG